MRSPFVLAVVVWCLLVHEKNTINRLLARGVLAGMPLVALGITLSKLNFRNWIESAASIAFVLIALLVVWQHLRLYSDKKQPLNARRYWLTAALCLLAGGALAAVYALRFHFPMACINIPNMKIWHGSLNAIGFGWLALRGWEEAWT